MAKLKQTNAYLMRLSIVATVFILLYWVWMLYITQSAAPPNTYKQQELIQSIEVQTAYHRGTDKAYIITQNNCYIMDLGWRDATRSYEFAQAIQTSSEAVTMTIWEHVPKYFFDLRVGIGAVQQIVDLRDDSTIYWNIEKHNDYQQRERIAGSIAGVFLLLFVVVLDYFIWHKMGIKFDSLFCMKRKGKRR